MSTWTAEELEMIEHTEELHLAPQRQDGSSGKWVTIWVVRVDNEVYVRSWRGRQGAWYSRALKSMAGRIRAGSLEKDVLLVPEQDPLINAQVDRAYLQKYKRYRQYAEAMASPPARNTTLRLVPREVESAGNL